MLQVSVLNNSIPGNHTIFVNTSHPGKLKEFQRLLSRYQVQSTTFDVEEPETQSKLDIIAYKATVVARVQSSIPNMVGPLVEDTSLDVEGFDIGTNVKWMLDDDCMAKCVGKKATWTTYLAYLKEGHVVVYQGIVEGTIVKPQGEGGFGFDPVFKPMGLDSTLAQAKPDSCNARALAVDAFIHGRVFKVIDPIYEWKGEFQGTHKK